MSANLRKAPNVMGLGLAAAVLAAACQPLAAAAPVTTSQPQTPIPSGVSSAGTIYPINPVPTSTSANNAIFAVMTAKNPSLGNILVDSMGETLYISRSDQPGISNCVESCAQTWLPLTPGGMDVPVGGPGVTGQVVIISRPYGGMQITYDGLPLYLYTGDTQPGDTLGRDMSGIWLVARP